MSERFYSDVPIQGPQTTLSGAESHHLLHVMRLKPGAKVVLFDGSGAEFDCEVVDCGRRDVHLAVVERREVDRELPAPLTIATALPKGDRQRWMVEKLTELGVSRVDFIQTERSVAKLSSSGLEKLRRAVIEASKQCRRNRLMEVCEPIDWGDYLGRQNASLRWIAHPTSPAKSDRLTMTGNRPSVIAIGPEGGFTDDEAAGATSAGWVAVDLGPRILRTETAAVASAAKVVGTQ